VIVTQTLYLCVVFFCMLVLFSHFGYNEINIHTYIHTTPYRLIYSQCFRTTKQELIVFCSAVWLPTKCSALAVDDFTSRRLTEACDFMGNLRWWLTMHLTASRRPILMIRWLYLRTRLKGQGLEGRGGRGVWMKDYCSATTIAALRNEFDHGPWRKNIHIKTKPSKAQSLHSNALRSCIKNVVTCRVYACCFLRTLYVQRYCMCTTFMLITKESCLLLLHRPNYVNLPELLLTTVLVSHKTSNK